MKQILFISLITLFTTAIMAQESPFYSFKVQDISGNDFDLHQLKGKKVLVVNTASKCGLTPQYEELQKLHEQYGSEKFVIIGFPANNFLKQEPGSNQDIKAFCTENYGVTFQMMSKISVKGKDMHPLYQWLTRKSENSKEDAKVQWNFQKFLIDEKGNWVKSISPRTRPMDEEIISWITGK